MEKATVYDFEEIYEIMHNSFPKDELRPRQAQKSLFKNKYYKMYIKRIDRKIAGFISVWDFGDFAYIEHFAVSSQLRGSGIGSKLLLELLGLLNKNVCLEIDPPENEIAKRRRRFYEGLGFKFSSEEWIQPPLGEEQNPVSLRLMTYPEMIDETTRKRYRRVILEGVFGLSE